MSRSAVLLTAASVVVVGLAAGAVALLLDEGADGDDREAGVVARPDDAADRFDGPAPPPERAAPEPVPVQPTAEELEALPRRGPEAVVGRVVDAETLAPLPAFSVDVLAAEPAAGNADPAAAALARSLQRRSGRAYRSANGMFRWPAKSGRYDVVVRAPGYAPDVRTGVLLPALDYEPHQFRLKARPGIAGVLTDAFGDPVRGADVHLVVEHLEDPGGRPPMNVAQTDAEGRFRFWGLPPGRYGVRPLERENARDGRAGVAVGPEGVVPVDLGLSPRPRLMVHVRDPVGRKVVGALVELQPLAAGGTYADGRSGVDGIVIVRHILPGEYDLLVSREGFDGVREALSLQDASARLERWVTLAPRPDG